MTKLTVGPEVHRVDLSPWAKYAPTLYFLGEAGVEPYKLLAHLARQLPAGSKVADLGTFQGASAVALASSPTVIVLSYDIADARRHKDIPRVSFILGNALDRVTDYADATLVHIDIDPHNGLQESVLIEDLANSGFKGVVICDDIYLNDGMKAFWDVLPFKKLDATRYGHHSGTGIVVFDPETIDVEIIE